MSNLEVIRAWKDPEFRATLSGIVPEHPAGQIEFADPGLLDRSSAAKSEVFDHSKGFCTIPFTACCNTHEKYCG